MFEQVGGNGEHQDTGITIDVDSLTQEACDILSTSGITALDEYRSFLRESTEGLSDDILSPSSLADRERHIAELDETENMLQDFTQNPDNYTAVIRQVKNDEENNQSTYTLRLQKQGTEIGNSEDLAVTQLTFHLKLNGLIESRTEEIESISLKGTSPYHVIHQLPHVSTLSINTVKVYRDVQEGKFKIKPQAGIGFTPRGSKVETYGIHYIGGRISTNSLPAVDSC